MSFLGNPMSFNSKPHLRTSDIQNYRPGEFLRRFDEQKESAVSYLTPPGVPEQTIFKDSFIGGLNSYTDDFYKSQVMERAIGGQPVLLNAMANYQPLSADDPIIREQIRQEHVKIMNQKLKQAIVNNGGNAVQQVKTVIVEPLTDVVEIKQSNVTQGYHGIGKKSTVSTAAMIPHLPSGHISGLTIGGPTTPSSRSRVQIQRRNSQVGSQQSHSRIEYVPFERKVTELETREWIEKVPIEKVVIQYEDRRIVQQVPVEKTVLDYYAVEHITQYEPKVIEQTIIEMVPVEKTYHTTNYIPIQQQIIHIPGENGQAGHSRILYQGPPTVEGSTAMKGQSRITYQPPIIQSGKSSAISYENPLVRANSGSMPSQRNSRTPSKLPPPLPPGKLSAANLPRRPVSPINVRSNQVIRQQNIDLNQGFYQYQEPIYIQNSTPTLPFTNQLRQIAQYTPETQYQYPQYQNVQYIQQVQQGNYPPPSQVQTFYQIPNQNFHQNPLYQQSGYAQDYSPPPAPHEVVHQQHKILRRQNSGISLTSINR